MRGSRSLGSRGSSPDAVALAVAAARGARAWRVGASLAASLAALLAAPLAACGGARSPAQRAPAVQYLSPDGPSTRPFSAAVRVGNMLYLSGQIGVLPNGTLIAGGIEPETRQTMENIRRVLERSGSSMDRVVKCLVMLADMREWDAMNAVYASFFPSQKPARSSFGANGLALGARVEIECWATVH